MPQKENLRRFKIVHSKLYIQIIPMMEHFRTQILIDKRDGLVKFEDIARQFQFSGSPQTKHASLILGVLEIDGVHFLLYSQEVYLEASLPPDHPSVYQIASINQISYRPFISSRERDVLDLLKENIFNFSFYFSFSRDLTLSYQKWRTELRPKSRDMYFWNEGMLKAMKVNESVPEWLVPVIQGHYGKFQLSIGSRMIQYYIISRRSKFRSGARFYNRGIDQNSKCAHFIQTQQILVIGNEILSLVALSGSPPIFWEQKFQKDKIKLTRNKELTAVPLIQHFNQIKSDYGRVIVINLLQRKMEGQKLLTTAMEQIIEENSSALQHFCRYVHFDLTEVFNNNSLTDIFQLLNKLDPLFKEFGFFKWDYLKNDILKLQRGVIRVGDLDCLNRTNRFLQAFFYYQLHEQLIQERVISGPTSSSDITNLFCVEEEEMGNLMVGFKTIWEEKADFESLIYSGSRATHGRQNKWLDDLSDSFISLQRLYNQKFMDEMKQKALDILLYHKRYRMTTMLRSKQNVPFHICIVTWNVNATGPDKLKELQKVAEYCKGADLVVFGVQEMIELSTNNVVMNNEEESPESTVWGKTLEKMLNEGNQKKIFVRNIEMVGLMQVIFISDEWKHAIKAVHKDAVKTGMGGQFGNKGAVALRLRIHETTVCFTCAHLTAGHSKSKERVEDIVEIHKKCFQQSKEGVQNESRIQESDYKFFFGDLNFRINGDYKTTRDLLASVNEDNKKDVVTQLLEHDQLTNIKSEQEIPIQFASYEEPEVEFLPTYKLDKRTGAYTEERSRVPSWCDRILYWDSEGNGHGCDCVKYTDINVVGSDHRPVMGRFQIIVNQDIRASNFIKYDLIS